MTYLFFVLSGYLSGSLLFCKWLPEGLLHKDICAISADGNPGASNVFIHCGVPMGMLCLLLDMAKGGLPVFLALRYLDCAELAFAAVVAAPVIGHAFSLWDRFHGGKCIATGFGVMIGLLSQTVTGFILAAIYILLSTLIKINPNRRRSIVAYTAFACIATPLLLWEHKTAIALGYLLIDLIVIYKHASQP